MKVLCVDDDDMVARLIAEVVEFCGHTAVVETDSMDAIAKHLRDTDIRAVLTDYMMPKMDGLELLSVWQEQRPDVRRVLITAAPQEAAVREALRTGLVEHVISKPPAIADVKYAVGWLR